MNKNVEIFRKVFDFLIKEYGFSFSYQIIDNIFGTGQYELSSQRCNFKLFRDRDQCSMIFWPSFSSEENAISLTWLFDYFIYLKENKPISSELTNDCSVPDVGEVYVFEKCLQEHKTKILTMDEFILKSSYDWWKDSKKYIKARINNIVDNYSKKG